MGINWRGDMTFHLSPFLDAYANGTKPPYQSSYPSTTPNKHKSHNYSKQRKFFKTRFIYIFIFPQHYLDKPTILPKIRGPQFPLKFFFIGKLWLSLILFNAKEHCFAAYLLMYIIYFFQLLYEYVPHLNWSQASPPSSYVYISSFLSHLYYQRN